MLKKNTTKTDPILVLIRKTNRQPFKQDKNPHLRKLIFSATRDNFDVSAWIMYG